MGKKIKIDKVILELPDGFDLPTRLSKHKESFEEQSAGDSTDSEQTYIYQPSDAYRHVLDEVEASTSISKSHKEWVKTTWFILHIIYPVLFLELGVFAVSVSRPQAAFDVYVYGHIFMIPVVWIYYTIWRKQVTNG